MEKKAAFDRNLDYWFRVRPDYWELPRNYRRSTRINPTRTRGINYEIRMIGEPTETEWGFLTKVILTKDTDDLKVTIHNNAN